MSPAELAPPIYSALGSDPDFVEVLGEFIDEIPSRLESLAASFASGDRDDVRRRAHQLKGAAGSYGFAAVTPVAARLETIAEDGADEAAIAAALADLSALCKRLQAGVPPAAAGLRSSSWLAS